MVFKVSYKDNIQIILWIASGGTDLFIRLFLHAFSGLENKSTHGNLIAKVIYFMLRKGLGPALWDLPRE